MARKSFDMIRVTRKGINMNIIDTDTPGFGDMDMDDEDTVQRIIQESGQIDLLLFCLSINSRLHRHNFEAYVIYLGKMCGRELYLY